MSVQVYIILEYPSGADNLEAQKLLSSIFNIDSLAHLHVDLLGSTLTSCRGIDKYLDTISTIRD